MKMSDIHTMVSRCSTKLQYLDVIIAKMGIDGNQ